MAIDIPNDNFNLKKPNWLKIAGIVLIIDGLISLAHPELAHNFLFDVGRVVRTGIGVYLVTLKKEND